jgi:hypothetical protein
MPQYKLLYDRRYLDDLETIDPFDIPSIREALLHLEHEAERQTRNRRPCACQSPGAQRRTGRCACVTTVFSTSCRTAWSPSFG